MGHFNCICLLPFDLLSVCDSASFYLIQEDRKSSNHNEFFWDILSKYLHLSSKYSIFLKVAKTSKQNSVEINDKYYFKKSTKI